MKYKTESKHFEQICGSKVDEIGVGPAQKGVSPLLGEHLSKQVLAQVLARAKRGLLIRRDAAFKFEFKFVFEPLHSNGQ